MINEIIDLAIDCGLMVTAVDIIDVKVKKFNLQYQLFDVKHYLLKVCYP